MMTEQCKPLEIAIEHINQRFKAGENITHISVTWYGSVSSSEDKQVSIWINLAGGTLFPDKSMNKGIKLKMGQIGIALYHKNGKNEQGVFSIRELWDQHINPNRVIQLNFLEQLTEMEIK